VTYSHDDSVRIQDWFNDGDKHKVEQIVFADNSLLSIEEISDMIATEGTDGRDYLRGFNDLDDKIYGFASDDRLYGYRGDDFLDGGSGNDKLYGGRGDDIFVGSKGDDKLYGDEGSDTYYFNLGDGNDTIKDRSRRGSSDVDRILFGEDIAMEDVTFRMDNNDLIVNINDSDSITVENWAIDDKYKIEEVQFADNTSLGADDIDEQIVAEESSRAQEDDNILRAPEPSVDSQSIDKESIDGVVLDENTVDDLSEESTTNSEESSKSSEKQEPISDSKEESGNHLTQEDVDMIVQDINAYAPEEDLEIVANNDMNQNQQLTQVVSTDLQSA
jgi:hypothetical protein